MIQQRFSSVHHSGLARLIFWLAALACVSFSGHRVSAATDEFMSQGKKYSIESFPPPAGGGKAKVVVIVHGSYGLTLGFDTQFADLAKKLSTQGYFVFLPSYFFQGNVSEASLDPKIHLQTLNDALDYAVKQPGVDAQRVALVGFSLGGGLSLALAESDVSKRIRTVVDFYGVTTADIVNQAAKLPPTLILHNKSDGIVPISNSQDLDSALGKNRIDHRFMVYEDSNPAFHDHPFSVGGDADKDSREQSVKWLSDYL